MSSRKKNYEVCVAVHVRDDGIVFSTEIKCMEATSSSLFLVSPSLFSSHLPILSFVFIDFPYTHRFLLQRCHQRCSKGVTAICFLVSQPRLLLW